MIPWRNLKRFFYKTLKQPAYAVKTFGRRLEANCYYLFGRGRSRNPEAITLFLTHRCNLRCAMCGQWGREGVTKKHDAEYILQELAPLELRAIIDDVASFNPSITLFGGEPLLYKGCIELIKYIKQKGMHCLIITNGYLIEELALDVVDSGLDELNVSLDGAAALHDQIRAMPGLFERITQGLNKVNYLKAELKKKKPLINLQCTITQYNYRHLEQLVAVAESINADSLTFHNLIFLNRDILERQKEYDSVLGAESSGWEGFVFDSGIDPVVLYEKIKEISSRKYRFSVDFYPNFSHRELLDYYRNPEFFTSGYAGRCLSPWLVAYIFPDAEVRPCLNSSYSYGNLKKNKFAQVWNSRQAVNYRRLIKEKGVFPVCSRCTEMYRY